MPYIRRGKAKATSLSAAAARPTLGGPSPAAPPPLTTMSPSPSPCGCTAWRPPGRLFTQIYASTNDRIGEGALDERIVNLFYYLSDRGIANSR